MAIRPGLLQLPVLGETSLDCFPFSSNGQAIRSLGDNYRQWDLQTFFPMEVRQPSESLASHRPITHKPMCPRAEQVSHWVLPTKTVDFTLSFEVGEHIAPEALTFPAV